MSINVHVKFIAFYPPDNELEESGAFQNELTFKTFGWFHFLFYVWLV